MNWLNRVWAGLLLSGLSLTLQAAAVQNMYEVLLPVTDQHQQSRYAAFEQGFAEVLVRVSGNSNLPTINMADAPSYVQQYRYLQLEKPGTAAVPREGELVATHSLWMQFDETAIKKLLRSNGLSVWGAQRPAVLVWMAVRDGQNRYILHEQDISPIRDAVMAEGTRRGLPLIWPSVNDKNNKSVQFTDLWGGFFESVQQASQGYAASAVLVGRMDWQKQNGWQINWSLLLNGQVQNWSQRSTELPVLMAAGINPVASQLATRFAVMETPSGVATLNILVNGVASAEAYAKVAHYLQSMALVKQVYATDISPGQAQFHLDINGGEDELRRTIALERILLPDAIPEVITQVQPINMQPGMPPEMAPVPQVAVPLLLHYKLN
jgi:hypothetical protein